MGESGSTSWKPSCPPAASATSRWPSIWTIPPWDIFGLPRLLVDAESIDRFLSMVDDPYNCLTLCSGSLNANPNNNVAEIVRKHCDRIAFAHIRNIHHI